MLVGNGQERGVNVPRKLTFAGHGPQRPFPAVQCGAQSTPDVLDDPADGRATKVSKDRAPCPLLTWPRSLACSATTARRRPCTTAAGTRPTAPSSASRSTGTPSTSAPVAGKDEGGSRGRRRRALFSDKAVFVSKKPKLFRICFPFCTSL